MRWAFLFLMLAADANATGIGVVPAELDFELEEGERLQKTLTVYNLGEEAIEFEVSSPAGYLQFYHNDSVSANGTEKITVEAVTAGLEEGNHLTTIYVMTVNGGAGVKFNLGTAVKAGVTVINPSRINPVIGVLISLTIVVVGMLVYFAVTRLPDLFSAGKA